MAENADLKTLPDMIDDLTRTTSIGVMRPDVVGIERLKQAAIAWVSHIKNLQENLRNTDTGCHIGYASVLSQEDAYLDAQKAWIMHFFGLTEEDVGE